MFRYYNGGGPSVKKMKDFVRTMVADPKQFDDANIEARYEASLDESHIEFYHRYNAAFARRHGMDPLWRDAHEIKAPTLLLWGTEDRTITFEGSQLMLKQIPNVQLHAFSKCGHWVQVERQKSSSGSCGLPGGPVTGWLEGNVALITGGGSGLGRAVAERFLDEGASVVVADRDPVKLGELVEAAGDRGDRVHTVEADVRSTADQHRAVSEAVARFGKLDTLVPNAGIWDYQRSITRLDGESLSAAFDELFAVNVKGYLLAVEASWRELVKTAAAS